VQQLCDLERKALIEKGIMMLSECWKKCIDSRGEYVEHWHVQVSV
jgi:hypothetical protein